MNNPQFMIQKPFMGLVGKRQIWLLLLFFFKNVQIGPFLTRNSVFINNLGINNTQFFTWYRHTI